MKSQIAFTLVLLLIGCSQYVPIPPVEHGLVLGDAQGSLHIRAFYDLLCNSMCYAGIDSKKSNSNIREALQTHGINGIKLTINFFPLPYHIYSFKVHQGYQYIKRIMGNNVANKYVQYVLNNQAAYYESKWTSNTIGEFLDSFTKDIKSILPINEREFRKALNAGSPEDSKVRAQWKYSSGTLGVSGTPIFYANDVRIDGAEDWNKQDWLAFFEKHVHS